MWRDSISGLTSEAEFVPGTTAGAIAQAEATLVCRFSPDLVSLLLESDGVTGEYDLPLIWSLDRIVEDNVAFRSSADFASLYMPFDPLLFFADAGNGDQFALLANLDREDVFAWDHETDSRAWYAPDLRTYLAWWLEGRPV